MPYEFLGEYLDENDVPVEGALVIANRRFDGEAMGTTLTAGDGTFTLDGLASNDLCYLTVIQDGFLPQVFDQIEPALYSLTLPAPVLSGEEVSGPEFDLSWTAVDSPFVSEYILYRSVNGGSFDFLAAKGVLDPLEYADTDISNPNTYDYRVVAVADGTPGVSDSAPSNVVSDSPAPPVITGISFSFISGSSPPGIPPFGFSTLTGSSFGTELTANPDLAGPDVLSCITFNLIHTGPVFQINDVLGSGRLTPYAAIGTGIEIVELGIKLFFATADGLTGDTWQWNGGLVPDFVDGNTYTVHSISDSPTQTVTVTTGDPSGSFPWTAGSGWTKSGWGYGSKHGDVSSPVTAIGSIDNAVIGGATVGFIGVEVEGADPSWIGSVVIGFTNPETPPVFHSVDVQLLPGGPVVNLLFGDASVSAYSDFGITGTDGVAYFWFVELAANNTAIKAAMDAYFGRPNLQTAVTFHF